MLAQISSQATGCGDRRARRSATKILQAEIRRTQALAALIDYEEARREVDEAEEKFAAASNQVVEATRIQAEAARHQAVAAHALPELRDAEVAAGAALQRVVVARETPMARSAAPRRVSPSWSAASSR